MFLFYNSHTTTQIAETTREHFGALRDCIDDCRPLIHLSRCLYLLELPVTVALDPGFTNQPYHLDPCRLICSCLSPSLHCTIQSVHNMLITSEVSRRSLMSASSPQIYDGISSWIQHSPVATETLPKSCAHRRRRALEGPI